MDLGGPLRMRVNDQLTHLNKQDKYQYGDDYFRILVVLSRNTRDVLQWELSREKYLTYEMEDYID